jgi:hypothetical protein
LGFLVWKHTIWQPWLRDDRIERCQLAVSIQHDPANSPLDKNPFVWCMSWPIKAGLCQHVEIFDHGKRGNLWPRKAWKSLAKKQIVSQISFSARIRDQGCQIFLGTIYQSEGKIYQMTSKLSNAHKTYPMVVKYYKWPEYKTTFSIPRSFKIYQKWDFWSEMKHSCNPVRDTNPSIVGHIK